MFDFGFFGENKVNFLGFVAAFEEAATRVLSRSKSAGIKREAGTERSRFVAFGGKGPFEGFERRERFLRTTARGEKRVFFGVLFVFSDF